MLSPHMVHSLAAIDFSLGGPYRTQSSMRGHSFRPFRGERVAVISADDPRHVDARCFADEVAIDFPALGDKVARMRHAFVESDVAIDWLRAEIHLSRRQAGAGAAIPIELPVRSTCRSCGGRGEVWGEACEPCDGSGDCFCQQTLTISVPPGVSDGARFTVSVSPRRGPRTRVEVRVAVT